jgi:tetratricopeptide (TPR) repeat protein
VFEQGRAAFEAGEFDVALARFQRAYQMSGRAALLFNMGSAAERLRHDEEAIGYYERYLREMSDAPNRQFVEARIRFLRANPRQDQEAAPAASGGSILDEWWFWTVLAVVVVGAAVGIGVGVAMSSSGQSAVAGNFGPDGVAMALVSF